MPKSIDYRYLTTLPAFLRIVALIFNILAILFVRGAENPYYDVKNVIKFNAIAIAGACFSIIALISVVAFIDLRNSLKWLRNELLIQCALIIVYVYGCVTMVLATIECYRNDCPRQLIATICGIAATITYIIDGVFKLCEWRRKCRVQRLTTANNDDAKVEEPYVDDVQESPTATVTTTEDEPTTVTATTQPQPNATD
ncbi:uncharacterized protein LOC116351908 [Contarinia nasturtii]|uniref:uncharacterized protein LOC116351908 n=1 Tax=Contarinia nasturtii TaxID=265458 RepID=UPI0012D37968|nr:uncharacterized protein LOC116351908 [Contarinia nasturtii]